VRLACAPNSPHSTSSPLNRTVTLPGAPQCYQRLTFPRRSSIHRSPSCAVVAGKLSDELTRDTVTDVHTPRSDSHVETALTHKHTNTQLHRCRPQFAFPNSCSSLLRHHLRLPSRTLLSSLTPIAKRPSASIAKPPHDYDYDYNLLLHLVISARQSQHKRPVAARNPRTSRRRVLFVRRKRRRRLTRVRRLGRRRRRRRSRRRRRRLERRRRRRRSRDSPSRIERRRLLNRRLQSNTSNRSTNSHFTLSPVSPLRQHQPLRTSLCLFLVTSKPSIDAPTCDSRAPPTLPTRPRHRSTEPSRFPARHNVTNDSRFHDVHQYIAHLLAPSSPENCRTN
jgi:hypothetical protein